MPLRRCWRWRRYIIMSLLLELFSKAFAAGAMMLEAVVTPCLVFRYAAADFRCHAAMLLPFVDFRHAATSLRASAEFSPLRR